ncbi:hypothetical protein COU37_04775 [Candidatus Micrarchaeota archaeon CG10_big_fil_rev_8_21_14_0_10_45_29]|nr:MAG: hypothetical protein COU37_04775 [Candidatus Micrarchaeota archaeon CG10_big_fil_rev_8_21_14_0_10_45_29]
MEANIKYISYAALGFGLLGSLGAFISGGSGLIVPISALLSFFGGVLAVSIFKYGYIILPLITQKSKIVQIMAGGYEIPPAQDVILQKAAGIYYASAYLGVKIYESTTDKSAEENMVYSEYFERAISAVRFPVKFSMMVYVKDMSNHRMKLETRHAEAQLRLAREREKPDPDVLKLDRFEKEVSMYEMQINRLVSGYKPMGAITYVMTTAVGLSKEAATAAAKSQANELRATISNALNVQVVLLQGDEMLKCFDWEHIIPSSASSMESSVL